MYDILTAIVLTVLIGIRLRYGERSCIPQMPSDLQFDHRAICVCLARVANTLLDRPLITLFLTWPCMQTSANCHVAVGISPTSWSAALESGTTGRLAFKLRSSTLRYCNDRTRTPILYCQLCIFSISAWLLSLICKWA